MGTRAIYTFKDGTDTFHVYKHWDNYPSGAAGFIEAALGYAFELPRFEADEFACAFIAANKKKDGMGGDLRLSLTNEGGWLDYRYEIYMSDGKLFVAAYNLFTESQEKLIFVGPLEEFKTFEEKGDSE